MLNYAAHHNGQFPEGKNSTEVFQQIIDFGYVDPMDGKITHDPGIFYVPMIGKTEPVAGQKLKPKNVSWDITSGVDSNAPDTVPLVFLTGYKITYAPGGTAVPIIKPFPPYTRDSIHLLNGAANPKSNPGIAVCYKSGTATFRHLYYTETSNSDITNPPDTIPNFIPTDFDSKGIKYRQLTPEGELLP